MFSFEKNSPRFFFLLFFHHVLILFFEICYFTNDSFLCLTFFPNFSFLSGSGFGIFFLKLCVFHSFFLSFWLVQNCCSSCMLFFFLTFKMIPASERNFPQILLTALKSQSFCNTQNYSIEEHRNSLFNNNKTQTNKLLSALLSFLSK